jgi:hypothetical protein
MKACSTVRRAVSVACLAVFTIAGCSDPRAEGTKSKEELLKQVEQAMENDGPAAVMALGRWHGSNGDWLFSRSRIKEELERAELFSKRSYSLEPLPGSGEEMEWTAKAVGVLMIGGAPDGEYDCTLVVGQEDGNFFLVGTTEEPYQNGDKG